MQSEFANELLVAGGVLGLAFDLLEYLGVGGHERAF